MQEFNKLLREKIYSIKSYNGYSIESHNYPAIGVECESGKVFEIFPVTRDIEPKLELFEIKVSEVSSFSEISKWPNGPTFEWKNIEVLNGFAKGKNVEEISVIFNDQGFLDGSPLAAKFGIVLFLTNGGCLEIRHSEKNPMSVDLSLVESHAT